MSGLCLYNSREEVHWIQLCMNSFTFHLLWDCFTSSDCRTHYLLIFNHGDVDSCSAINVLYKLSITDDEGKSL